MCGVPVHSADQYLARLIRDGFRVAVCEQVEDPAEARKRGAKSVVKRDVVRLVTAGTLTEDSLLDARRNNYLLAIARSRGAFGIAWLDMSTGELSVSATIETTLPAELARLDPGEILLPDTLVEDGPGMFADWDDRLSPLPSARFDSVSAEKRLKQVFDVGALDGFGAFSRAEVAAAGAVVDYVDLTQKGNCPRSCHRSGSSKAQRWAWTRRRGAIWS